MNTPAANTDATHIEYLIARGRTPDDIRTVSPQPYIAATSPTTCVMDKNTMTVDEAIELQETMRAQGHIKGLPATLMAYNVNVLDRMSANGTGGLKYTS